MFRRHVISQSPPESYAYIGGHALSKAWCLWLCNSALTAACQFGHDSFVIVSDISGGEGMRVIAPGKITSQHERVTRRFFIALDFACRCVAMVRELLATSIAATGAGLRTGETPVLSVTHRRILELVRLANRIPAWRKT
jgi:hypothetical protein